jgi:hypothetical protein
MKTLVIHPNDETTDFLSRIYADKNWTVLNSKLTKAALTKQIKAHDRIVMLGHGCERGLLQFRKLIIDKTFVPLLKEKSCVCIWCYADEFVNEHGLKGFYTGMFISELIETFANDIDSNWDDIRQSNSLFAEAVNQYIYTNNMLENVKEMYMCKGEDIYEGDVINFNRDRLYFMS